MEGSAWGKIPRGGTSLLSTDAFILQFDSLVQTATGFNTAEAEAYAKYKGGSGPRPLPPKALPLQALDHAAGYLLAFGINAALCKTITVSIMISGSSLVEMLTPRLGGWLMGSPRFSCSCWPVDTFTWTTRCCGRIRARSTAFASCASPSTRGSGTSCRVEASGR